MGKITNEMVEYTYSMATKVYSAEINRKDAMSDISAKTGMNKGSASDYIKVFVDMMNGRCYKRTINVYATDYYLNHIGIDYGRESQIKAANATLEHVQYYKEVKDDFLKSIYEIACKYK